MAAAAIALPGHGVTRGPHFMVVREGMVERGNPVRGARFGNVRMSSNPRSGDPPEYLLETHLELS